MVTVTYVLLHIMLLIVFYVYSKRIDRDPARYWKIATVPIVFFALEEGLRWGRFIDWCAYYGLYNDVPHTWEFLFRNWWSLFNSLGVPYPVVITLCSLIYVVSLFFLFRPYAGLFSIFFPLIIAFSALSAENFIRWYCALSVIFVSFRFLLDKRWLPFAVFACMVPLVHFGTVPLLILFILIVFIKRPISPMLTICLSIGCILFFNSSFLLRFTNVVDFMFGHVEKFTQYMNNVEGWITGSGQNSDMERKSMLVYLISMIPFYCIIWGAHRIRKDLGTEYQIMYNLGALGVLVLSISSGLEILLRYAEIFYPFLSLLCAYVIKRLPRSKAVSYSTSRLLASMCYLFIIWKFIVFVRPLGREEFMCYVWNYWLSPYSTFNLY